MPSTLQRKDRQPDLWAVTEGFANTSMALMKQQVSYLRTVLNTKIENNQNYKMYIRLLSPMYTIVFSKTLLVRKAADLVFSTASRGQRIISLL